MKYWELEETNIFFIHWSNKFLILCIFSAKKSKQHFISRNGRWVRNVVESENDFRWKIQQQSKSVSQLERPSKQCINFKSTLFQQKWNLLSFKTRPCMVSLCCQNLLNKFQQKNLYKAKISIYKKNPVHLTFLTF